MKQKLFFTLAGVALIVPTVTFASWLNPGATPPSGNTAEPINVSSTAQIKEAGLLLNTVGATNGLIVQYGNVGINTVSPSQKLDVNGYVKTSSGFCIGSSCITSWAGTVGPQGPAGPAGATGATGATGPAGTNGTNGAQGPKGDTGATGAQGVQGPAGAAGAVGATGPQGPVGPSGAANATLTSVTTLGNSTTNGIIVGGAYVTGGLQVDGVSTFINPPRLATISGNTQAIENRNANLNIVSEGAGGFGTVSIYQQSGRLAWGGGQKLKVYGSVHANSFCFQDDTCISSWPSGGGTPNLATVLSAGNTTDREMVIGGNNRISFFGAGSVVALYEDYGLNITGGGSWPVRIGSSEAVTNLIVSGSVTQNSDRTLKKDIVPLENALDKVTQLEGVSFKWKNNDSKAIGVIAQDVEKVFPEAVRTDAQTGLKSVQYGNLVAPLIEAIKELQAEVNALKAEIKTLKP